MTVKGTLTQKKNTNDFCFDPGQSLHPPDIFHLLTEQQGITVPLYYMYISFTIGITFFI